MDISLQDISVKRSIRCAVSGNCDAAVRPFRKILSFNLAMCKSPPIIEVLPELLALKDPRDPELDKASVQELRAERERLRPLLLELIEHGLHFPEFDGEAPDIYFGRLLLKIAGRFDQAVHGLWDKEGEKTKGRPAGFTLPELSRVEAAMEEVRADGGKSPSEASPLKMAVLAAGGIVSHYGMALMASEVLGMRASWVFSPSLVATFDRSLHSSLEGLAHLFGRYPDSVDQLLHQLVQSIVSDAARVSRERESTTNSGHKPGSFSWIKPHELAPIAARDGVMVRRYGAKSLESIFEQKVALVFQSFGFLVIPTTKGKRSVDLLCLSNDGPKTFSIMIEAKTTKGYYSLPTKDERALREYVESVRNTMRTLPEVKLLLLVAPRSASTLDTKIKALSSTIGLPIRFLPAQRLADLREAVPGAIPSDLLLSALLAQPEEIGPNFAEDVAKRVKRLQDAHQQLAKDLEGAWEG